MKRYLFLLLSVNCGLTLSAQISVQSSTPLATLDINAIANNGTTSEGIGMPRLSGDQIKNAGSQYTSAQTGTIVYATSIPTASDTKTANIVSPGCYYFDGNIWRSMGTVNNTTVISYSTIVDPNILGYVPSNTSTASAAPSSLTAGSGSYTKEGIISFTTNGHSYAAYSGSASITWFDAYTAAKNMGGYLATFTTDNEWKFVEQNLLDNHTAFNTQKAWIGFVKFSWQAGAALLPDPEEKWITGEKPYHDYAISGNSAVKKTNWFATGEPNNTNSNEGFVHTYDKNSNITLVLNGYTSTHPWNDFPSNQTSVSGFIVEFQQ